LSAPVLAQNTTQPQGGGTGDSQPGAQTQQSLPADPMKQDEPRAQSQGSEPGAHSPRERDTQSQSRPNPGQPGTGQPGTGNGTARPGTAQPGTGQPGTDPGTAQPGTDSAMGKRERDYQAALKKCGDMDGAARQQCVDAAKRKFGEM
jgi:hypothetical protein